MGRVLGRHRAGVHRLNRRDPGVLQGAAFVGDVQQVGVGRVRRLPPRPGRDRNLVLPRVFQQRRARVEIPFAPRCDHVDVGIEGVIGELEPDLVVALAGGAVGDRIRAQRCRDLDLALGDERPRDRGAEQVHPLVERVGPEHGKHVVGHEGLPQILDEDLRDPHRLGLLPRRRDLLALAEIGGERHHLAAIGFLQPAQDDRGIEPAGIGEHYFFHVFHVFVPGTGRHWLPRGIGARSIGKRVAVTRVVNRWSGRRDYAPNFSINAQCRGPTFLATAGHSLRAALFAIY